ncbi:hypothetical protein BDZ88DRAFT_505611 [Geranomyces variabilis]|nr:hypothetical protein BDZ88DRAFT_505611 [Geranomyces variabilis]KAJ3134930.1 hypothetical protein HDU90_004255 [Geranomyces variabilis]
MSGVEASCPDLESCRAVVLQLNATLQDTQSALDASLDNFLNMSYEYGYNADAINWTLAACIQVIMVIMVLDRLATLTHKQTLWTFWIASISAFLGEIVEILGSAVDWFFGQAGTGVFFYGRGVFFSINQCAVVYLLYLRVADALARHSRQLDRLCFWLTLFVLPLELAKQWYAAVKWTIEGDDTAQLYADWLVYLSPSYRTTLDIIFTLFTFHIIRAGSSAARVHHGRRRLMSEDTAFLIGYGSRVVLFLAVDFVLGVALGMQFDDNDLRLSSMALWATAQVTSPIKPFLVLTDIARIRSLSSEDPSPAQSTGKLIKSTPSSKAVRSVESEA